MRVLSALFLALAITELLLHLFIRYELGVRPHPILFYNPYCDEQYWRIHSKWKKFNDTGLQQHPSLSFAVEPQSFKKSKIVDESLYLFGSSFIGHKNFKDLSPPHMSWHNFAVSSYGLDQIYLSYDLAKQRFPNSTIVVGFLLEDLDRAIFSFREYQKVIFEGWPNPKLIPSNIPINSDHPGIPFDIYTFRLLKNFYSLNELEFQPKSTRCHLEKKKALFDFFMTSLLSSARSLNQNIIIISFNFEADFKTENKNWRQKHIEEYFSRELELNGPENWQYINSHELLRNDAVAEGDAISSYYDPIDRHYSEKGFEIIIGEIKSSIGIQ